MPDLKITHYLEQSPFVAIYRSQQLIHQQVASEFADHRLGFQQMLLLISLLLEGSGAETSPGRLSHGLNLAKSSISHILSNLENKKLIRRSLHANDSRVYNILLTRAGERMANKGVKLFERLESEMIKKLGHTNLDLITQKINEMNESL